MIQLRDDHKKKLYPFKFKLTTGIPKNRLPLEVKR